MTHSPTLNNWHAQYPQMLNDAMWHELLQKYNAVNTYGFVAKVKPQRKAVVTQGLLR